MAKGNPNPKNQFSKTNQPSKRGRGPKKSKLKELALENNLGANDVSLIIRNMFDSTEDELKTIIEDKNQPFLIRAFSRAFFDDVQQGRLQNINFMLDRAIGKVTDKTQMTTIDKNGEEIGVGIDYNKLSTEALQEIVKASES